MIKLTLYKALEKHNISRYELAKRTGVRYQTIDKYYKNNFDENTVALFYADNHMIPPLKWMHDLNIKNAWSDSIKTLLIENNYPVPYDWQNPNFDIFH